jgi:hypothetical protein
MGGVEAGDVVGVAEVGRGKERGAIEKTQAMRELGRAHIVGILARVCWQGIWGPGGPPGGVQVHVCGIQAGQGPGETTVGLGERGIRGDWISIEQMRK